VFCRFCLPHCRWVRRSRITRVSALGLREGEGWMDGASGWSGGEEEASAGTGPQISLDSKNRCRHWGGGGGGCDYWRRVMVKRRTRILYSLYSPLSFNVRTAYIHVRVKVFHKTVVPADNSSTDRCSTPLLQSLCQNTMWNRRYRKIS
jgi:hypothetical protein